MAHQDIIGAISDLITGDSALGFTKGTNLFNGPIRPHGTNVPKEALFINAFDGNEPVREMGLAKEVRTGIVELRYRSAGFAAGRAKILAIQATLLGTKPAGFLDMPPGNSEPIHEGPNQDGMEIFTLQYGMVQESS